MKLKNYKKNTIAFATLTKHSLIKREVLISLAFDTLPHTWENDNTKLSPLQQSLNHSHFRGMSPAGFMTFSKCGDTFPHAWDKLGYEYILHSSSRIIPTRMG